MGVIKVTREAYTYVFDPGSGRRTYRANYVGGYTPPLSIQELREEIENPRPGTVVEDMAISSDDFVGILTDLSDEPSVAYAAVWAKDAQSR